ncbi:MAG: hybrid sensor histidine kinase/response regulator [Desulfobacteraceae bacterium 4572_89]|nr:MAG: hybrid sensor histidine kinase/response regulator [Desulfobacteraceae bacterium 4572_89]
MFLYLYIEESLDHLSDIETDLLTIEEGGKNVDLDIVNNVFRAAHSIKGGAGFMGLTTIKDLAHNLENVLDLIRNLELVPSSEIISVLLKGFDRLENLMNNIQTSNEKDVSTHIEALKNITAAPPAEPVDTVEETAAGFMDITLPDGRIFAQIPREAIDQSHQEGKFIYLVEYDLIHDIHNKTKNPVNVITSLEKTGIILDARIDFPSVGNLDETALPSLIPVQILFASILEPEMTDTLFDLDEEYIHLINEDMISLTDENRAKEAGPMPVKELQTKKVQPALAENAPAMEPVVFQPVEKKEVHAAAAAEVPAKTEARAAEQEAVINNPVASKPVGSLRVNVNLLDTLMNLAGELVLSRNQLLQGINSSNVKATEISSQRIDMITSELQEAIMRTRMQPIANVFNKFTRVVRDLSRDLEKNIEITILGKDVELDKTILESINDPLTHLIRNSVDHGIELPQVRERAGKPAIGHITLKAYHDAGQVNIVISDDGKGLDPNAIAQTAVAKGLKTDQQVADMTSKEKTELILLPGFSTAEKITDVSGRGVGMDVVMTNLEKLGGIIEIDSTPGKGTDIQIKLPLTLAIIPSQIISVGHERYAVPQVNLDELLRIPAAQIKNRVEKVGDADVVRLRGNLLPLLNLSKVLGIKKTFIHPEDNQEYPDQRATISDRRSPQHATLGEAAQTQDSEKTDQNKRAGEDRRYHANSAINIAVVSAGSFKYGLVVDELKDSEEIVVKPLGRHLKKCSGYAGATIMGDGRVALILDVSSLAQMAELTTMAEAERVAKEAKAAEEARERARDKAALLVFRNGEKEHFAAPLNLVERIERIPVSTIEMVGGKKVVQYRGGALPLYELSQVASVEPLPPREQQEVIVFTVKGRELGLMVSPPVDAVQVNMDIDDSTLKQPCINGSMIIEDSTTLLVDIFEMVKTLNPKWFEDEQNAAVEMISEGRKVILFAEDSAFFRKQVKGFMTEEGYEVIDVEDGAEAWEVLQQKSDAIDIVVTDLEMPNMNGFELTQRIKSDPRFSHFSVIALTSLASESHVEQGKRVGIDAYEIKLDRENLMKIIRQFLGL